MRHSNITCYQLCYHKSAFAGDRTKTSAGVRTKTSELMRKLLYFSLTSWLLQCSNHPWHLKHDDCALTFPRLRRSASYLIIVMWLTSFVRRRCLLRFNLRTKFKLPPWPYFSFQMQQSTTFSVLWRINWRPLMGYCQSNLLCRRWLIMIIMTLKITQIITLLFLM